MKRKTISIIGTGVIGAGWAARFLASGHYVKAYDHSERALKKLKKDVRNALASLKRIGLNRQILGGPELVREEAAELQGFNQ